MKISKIAKLSGVGIGTVSKMLYQMSIPIAGIEYEGIRPVYSYSRKNAIKVIKRIKEEIRKNEENAKLFLTTLE